MILLLCFFAHFLGDFTPLSTNWMLACKSNFKYFKDFKNILGILAHAGTHAVLLTAIGIVFFGWIGLIFGLINFIFHAFIDCLKPMLTNYLVKRGVKANESTNRRFWEIMGFDQFLHAATIIISFSLILKTV